jgi:hypothetical protein
MAKNETLHVSISSERSLHMPTLTTSNPVSCCPQPCECLKVHNAWAPCPSRESCARLSHAASTNGHTPLVCFASSGRFFKHFSMMASLGDGALLVIGVCRTFIQPQGSRVTTRAWLGGTTTQSLMAPVIGSEVTMTRRALLSAYSKEYSASPAVSVPSDGLQ